MTDDTKSTEEKKYKKWTDNNRKSLEDELIDENRKMIKSDGQLVPHVIEIEVFSDKEPIPLTIYKVKTEVLSFNFDNVRIKKYREARCKKLEIDKLNPLNDDHQKEVQNILLTTKPYSAMTAASLQESLASTTQKQPCLVSKEGILLNGNRRLSVFNHFYENGYKSKEGNSIKPGDGKWQRILVAPLPEMTDTEFRSLEKRLQQRPSTIEAYGEINEIIDIRDSFEEVFTQDDGTLRNYRANENDGGATSKEKEHLEIEFKDLREVKVKFDWLADQVEKINLIDEHLKNHKDGDRTGQYELVEDKTLFHGGLTHFEELVKYRKKLEAHADPNDPFFVESRILAAKTALKRGKGDFQWTRDQGTMLTPKAKRSGDTKNIDCDTMLEGYQTNSPIIQDPKRYFDNPELLNDENTIKQEEQALKTTSEIFQKSKEDPKIIIKQVLETLNSSIRISGIPHNDPEFLEDISNIKNKLDEYEKTSKSN